MRSARSGRGLAIGAVCAMLAFAVPASAQAGAGAGKGRADAANAKVKDRSSARSTERWFSDRQYVRLAGARLGFCLGVD